MLGPTWWPVIEHNNLYTKNSGATSPAAGSVSRQSCRAFRPLILTWCPVTVTDEPRLISDTRTWPSAAQVATRCGMCGSWRTQNTLPAWPAVM